MATAATAKGNGWPGSSGRARCTLSNENRDEELDALSGSAPGGALAPWPVNSRLEELWLRPDSESGVKASSAERFLSKVKRVAVRARSMVDRAKGGDSDGDWVAYQHLNCAEPAFAGCEDNESLQPLPLPWPPRHP